jgi:hypothetical protein
VVDEGGCRESPDERVPVPAVPECVWNGGRQGAMRMGMEGRDEGARKVDWVLCGRVRSVVSTVYNPLTAPELTSVVVAVANPRLLASPLDIRPSTRSAWTSSCSSRPRRLPTRANSLSRTSPSSTSCRGQSLASLVSLRRGAADNADTTPVRRACRVEKVCLQRDIGQCSRQPR